MQFVTVTLTAAEIGGRLTLYDANGRKVGSVSKEFASEADQKRLTEIMWTRKLKAMSIVNLKFAEQANRDASEWGVKIDTWVKCIRLRQVDKRREREGKRYFSADSRPDWAAAIKCMQFSHRNRLRRKDKHAANPWLRWAETCSKNHNRKERNRATERREERAQGRASVIDGTQTIVGGSELQVCPDWNGIDASPVIA